MDVRLLGPIEIELGDGRAPLRRGRQRLLVASLALRPGERVGLGRLTEALWPDGPPKDPANTIQQLVAQVRRGLGAERSRLQTVEGGYRLQLAPDETDVGRVTVARAAATRLARDGAVADARTAVADALAQWRGPELGGVEDGPLGIEARRLVDLHADLHVLAADLAARADDLDGLADRLADACARHPLHEPLWARWIDAMARAGRPADALATYEQFRRRLVDDLGVDPSPELRELHERLLRDEAPARPAATPAAMPAMALTSFVGRSTERAQLADWLAAGARIVTVVGAGGVGKTRLVAEHLRGRAGVVFVRLEQVRPDGDAAAAVAAAGGLREDGARPLVEVIADGLPADALVVLDNAEHVTTPLATLVATLVSRRADITVLLTSQRALGVPGEHVLRLDPLPLPDGVDLASAARSDAVALLLDRVAHARPAHARVDDEALTAAVAIAGAVDGVPLAIELAAARAAVMSLPQLAASLGDRLGLLDHPVPGRSPRHRRLADAVGWSLDLLAPEERATLLCCSVFTGCFGAAAAGHVTGTEQDAALALLVALAEHSLVHVEDGDGDPRFRLLQPVRAHALRALADDGREARTRDRLLGWVVGLVEAADDGIRGPGQLAWMRRLDDARGDIDLVITHALQAGRVDAAARVVGALGRYWDWRGRLRDQQRWTDAVTSAADDAAPPRRLGGVLAWRAFVAIEHGDLERAADLSDRALAVSRAMDDADGETAALACQATLLRGAGRFEASIQVTEQALAAARRAGLPWEQAWAHNSRGFARVAVRDLDGATADAEESLRRFQDLGDERAVQWSRLLRALTAYRRGDAAAARDAACEVMTAAERHGDLRTASTAYDLLGELADDDAEAAHLHGVAARFRAQRGQVPPAYADVAT